MLSKEKRTEIVQKWVDGLRKEVDTKHFDMESWASHKGSHSVSKLKGQKWAVDCGTTVCGWGSMLVSNPTCVKLSDPWENEENVQVFDVVATPKFAKSLESSGYNEEPAYLAAALVTGETESDCNPYSSEIDPFYEAVDDFEQLFTSYHIKSPKVFAKELVKVCKKYGMNVK